MGQMPNGTGSVQRLFVGNLSTQTTEGELRAMVGRFGTVQDVHLVRSVTTGVVCGFAFVQMSNGQEVARAIEGLDGTEANGRRLKVRRGF